MISFKNIQRPQLILVVDDQEINRDAIGVILEDSYEVLYAENGRDALEQIEKNINNLCLVLLDLIMPEMDGYEVLKVMREDEQMKHIPVIVTTSEKNAELEALKLGAADFITKPFDNHEVIRARVDRIIELNERRKLINSAEYDPLTMLYHRSFFFEYVNSLYQYHKELEMDAVVMNIEQFHSVNAVNGRSFGDAVLKLIGDEVRAFLATTEGIAARYNADRFDIYCKHHDDYAPLLKKIQDAVNTLSPNVNIHLRMGVMPYKEGMDPVLMFDCAFAACNMVRGNYQSPLMVYDENMRKKELLNQRLLNDLNAAVEERQLMVFYQPKYNIQCDPPRLSSAEALVRWKHPELGMVSPGDFIPLFESNGLISVVDSYVWKEAARQIAEWEKKYGKTIPVSVNVSRADVVDKTVADRIKNLVNENGLDYKDFKLEVTESAYTDNAMQMLNLIEHMRSTGFEIEMDDFGSGYSSLNMLSAMPIDILKMDMKFVRNIEESDTDLKLVMLILDIAKYLNLKVVAEGVETEGQLKLLRDAGCDLVQGFYFSRPVPPEEFEKLIEKELEIERSMS